MIKPSNKFHQQKRFVLLADRTNGRAFSTVLRPSSVCLYGMYCG